MKIIAVNNSKLQHCCRFSGQKASFGAKKNKKVQKSLPKNNFTQRVASLVCAYLYTLSIPWAGYSKQNDLKLDRKTEPPFPFRVEQKVDDNRIHYCENQDVYLLKNAKLTPVEPLETTEQESDLARSAIEFASQFEGMNEKEIEDATGYEFPDGQWCAAFQYYVLSNTTNNLPEWYPDFSNKCSDVFYLAKKNNMLVENIDEVKPGDIAIIAANEKSNPSHMGMVVSVREDNTIETIEGNTGAQGKDEYCVARKIRNVGDDKYNIMAFVRLLPEEKPTQKPVNDVIYI